MALAVEGSAAVMLCISKRYKESQACRAEAEYAFQQRKRIIPLMLERNYRCGPRGPNEGRHAGLTYTHIALPCSTERDHALPSIPCRPLTIHPCFFWDACAHVQAHWLAGHPHRHPAVL